MKEQIDILNFEFSTKGVRDIGIVEPVLSFIELKYNLLIKRECITDNFCEIINKYNPKMIVVAHGIGTTNHFEMVKYASMKGIKVITFIAEGDMVDIKENVEILLWGNNTDRVFYEYANLQWSEKNINLILKHIPDAANYRMICTGGTGFDRYKFLPLKSKTEFFSLYPQYRNYKKIVGIAGFPFYFFLSDLYKKDGQWHNMHLDHEACDIMGTQKEPLRLMYKSLIEQNPDILFILKYHPSDIMKELSDFHELNEFKNTLSIYKEETIDNIINISDLWIGFESTTCLEAWLLNKTTFIVNPDLKKFVRSIISEGSPQYGNINDLNQAIRNFFDSGLQSSDFDSIQDKRENAIRQVIGFGDGCNHVRAAEFIVKNINSSFSPPATDSAFLNKIERKYRSIEIRKKLRSFIYNTPLILIPKIRKEKEKDILKELEFKADIREQFAKMYKDALKIFHQKTGALN